MYLLRKVNLNFNAKCTVPLRVVKIGWWPFDTDSLNATSVVSQTAGGQTASLGTSYNVYVSPFGRFGHDSVFEKIKQMQGLELIITELILALHGR